MTEELALVQVVRGDGDADTFPTEDLRLDLAVATDAQILESAGRALDKPNGFMGMVVTKSSKGIVISEPAVYG